MVTCPTVDQCVAVSTVIRPVRLTADVAVKRASRSGVGRPSTTAQGEARTAVPTAMTSRNPSATATVGLICGSCGCRAILTPGILYLHPKRGHPLTAGIPAEGVSFLWS